MTMGYLKRKAQEFEENMIITYAEGEEQNIVVDDTAVKAVIKDFISFLEESKRKEKNVHLV